MYVKETIHNVENIFVIIFLTNISLFSNKGKYPIIKPTQIIWKIEISQKMKYKMNMQPFDYAQYKFSFTNNKVIET